VCFSRIWWDFSTQKSLCALKRWGINLTRG
jgi:hypothetical protein